MTEAIGVGKNIEKAIEDALLQLKTSRDNVDIKILETGGIFKKAKVEVSISKDYIEEYKKLNQIKTKLKKEEKQKQEKIKQSVVNEKAKTQTKIIPKPEKSVKEEVVEQPKAKQLKQPKAADKQDKTKSASVKENENQAELGKEFLEGFLKIAKIDAVVDVFEDEEEIFYTIMGEQATSLIGYRGESLNSLQFLVSVLSGRNNRKSKRVKLDIDGYREKRKNTLELLAKRVAKKVQKTKRQTRLEPMTAYERRIIHTTVQEFEGVVSLSRGKEPHRYLIIKADAKQQEGEPQEVNNNTNS